jgi:hypothetical protein
VCAIAVLVRSFASVHRKLLQLVSQACIAYRHNKCTRYFYRIAALLTIIVPACVLELCNVGPSRYIYNARHVALVISLVTTITRITRYNVL